MDINRLISNELNRAEKIFANVDPAILSGRIEFSKKRDQQPVLNVPQFNHLRILTTGLDLVTEPATSDDDSGPENSRPTLGDVADAILDSQMLQFTSKYYPVPWQSPTLIFFHISRQLKRTRLQSIMNKGNKNPVTVKIADYTDESGTTRCAIVIYQTAKEANKAYNIFKQKQRSQKLGKFLSVDDWTGSKCSVLWMLDTSKDPTNRWAGVVIRNLSLNTTREQVGMLVNEQVLRIERLKMVRGELCALVVVKDVDIAERIANNFNKKKLSGGNHILVHLHPNTNIWLRPRNTHHMFLLSKQEPSPRKIPKILPTKPVRQFKSVTDLIKSFTEPTKTYMPIKRNALDALIRPN